ncbi:laccase isoform X2 [Lingula anatina]|uniref:Laccase isoform X2 n=1 Tax=Lingula anatina TaxID=7574 RepID=A0A1S3HXJ6_LINAN|nr:laccase isoform X2 [Lingula anatina]|eukprot:XP_013389794.1 laccase isoform X2 [Lingula anatina]
MGGEKFTAQRLVFLLVSVIVFSAVQADRHECARVCQRNVHKTCEYNFTVEWYLTLSKACYECPFNLTDCHRPHCIAADGHMRAVVAVNRQIPGPMIEVCEGDTLVVNVKNELEDGESTVIHWHGIHQMGTPYMDGVSMITQCPIPQFTTFRYTFKASPAGTHFYHSHVGSQIADGLYGALIVRKPPEDEPHRTLYDEDLSSHVVQLADWFPEPSNARFIQFVHKEPDFFLPVSLLLNGRSDNYEVKLSSNPNITAKPPLEVFHVTQGNRYRFRFTNAGHMKCQFKVSVDAHNLTVIAADGVDVKPLEVDAFGIKPGERFDVVLHANQSVGNYWLKAAGLVDCGFLAHVALGVIRYDGAADEYPTEDRKANRLGKYLNPTLSEPWNPIATHGPDFDILMDELENFKNENFTDENVDAKYYLEPFFIFYSYLPRDPENHDIDSAWFCNHSTVNTTNCGDDLCKCTHMVEFKLNQVVEMVLINEGKPIPVEHALHLHGAYFRVLGVGKLESSTSVEEIKTLHEEGNLRYKLISPSYRDTVIVPDNGYAIIRFRTDNPGVWLFHCHFNVHLNLGQAMLLKFGDFAEYPSIPANLPRCGSWGGHVYKDATHRDQCPKQPVQECKEPTATGSRSLPPFSLFQLVIFVLQVSWIKAGLL